MTPAEQTIISEDSANTPQEGNGGGPTMYSHETLYTQYHASSRHEVIGPVASDEEETGPWSKPLSSAPHFATRSHFTGMVLPSPAEEGIMTAASSTAPPDLGKT